MKTKLEILNEFLVKFKGAICIFAFFVWLKMQNTLSKLLRNSFYFFKFQIYLIKTLSTCTNFFIKKF